MALPVACINVNARAKHTATLIFLHGFTQTGRDIHPVILPLAERLPHFRIVIPTAPLRPVTISCGQAAHAWFDAFGFGHDSRQDKAGVEGSSELLRALIAKEQSLGIDCQRIVLGGFSQGGALALYTALTDRRRFAAVLALSTWLPLFREFPKAAPPEGGRLSPILQCHGELDQTILAGLGSATGHVLKKFCPRHQLKMYEELEHDVTDYELADIADFLQKHVPVTVLGSTQ